MHRQVCCSALNLNAAADLSSVALQCAAVCCSVLQCVAVHCSVMWCVCVCVYMSDGLQELWVQFFSWVWWKSAYMILLSRIIYFENKTHCNTLRHTTTHCNTSVSVRVCVCMCERERDRERVGEGKRDRARERERSCVCVRVCVI